MRATVRAEPRLLALKSRVGLWGRAVLGESAIAYCGTPLLDSRGSVEVLTQWEVFGLAQ
jgi:hypothetical protein